MAVTRRQREQAMAMKRRQQEQALQASPAKPQFFRILLPGFSHRLTIPQPFNKYIDGEIQKKASVVSPLGKSWPVEVHRAASVYYFGEGWQEFSEAHDLNGGYLLLFRYEGEMVFTVTVFDQTTCMKEYSPAGIGNKMVDVFCSHVGVEPYESPKQQMCLYDVPVVEMTKFSDSLNQNTSTEGSQFKISITSLNPCEEPYLPLPQELIKCFSGENGTLAASFSSFGKSWHVKILKDGKSFYVTDGWQSFSVAHKLRRGDSLVFTHKGALIFDVAVFDNSICETDCKLDVVSGIVNDRILTEETSSDKDYKFFEASPTHLCGKNVVGAMEPTSGRHQSVEMKENVACNGDVKAPNVGNGSKRRPHFEVVINLSKDYSKYTLEIPSKFATSTGLSRFNKLFLRDPKGRLWPVRLSHRLTNQQWYAGRSSACAGWRDFCVGNNLQNGDVCSFELKAKNELHVKIHRKRRPKFMKGSKDTSLKLKRSLCGQTAGELVKSEMSHEVGQARITQGQKMSELMESCMPGSQFTCTMFQTNILGKAFLNIPSSFLSSVDLFSMRRIILVDPKAQWWPVNVYHHRARRLEKLQIRCGWKAFCIGNNVEVGDRCIFKLASTVRNPVFLVKIIKRKLTASTKVADAVECTTGKYWPVEMEEFELCNRDGVVSNMLNGSTKRPHFEVVINLSMNYSKYRLEFPAKFVESNSLSSVNQLFLRDPNGKLWPIRLSHRLRQGNARRSTAYAGWKDFLVGNNLQDGDICTFELKAKNELHVNISSRRSLKSRMGSKDTSWKLKRSFGEGTAAELVKSETYYQAGKARITQDQKMLKLVNKCIPGAEFTCTIFPSNILGKAHLNIPSSFSSSVDLSSARRIILVDPKARRWQVRLYHWRIKTKWSFHIGSSGWKAFFISNNVEVGDRCIFKLASRVRNVVFLVKIIKEKAKASL